MDSMIAAAARALTSGDPLGALKRVALRDDAPALALRGIAMAQLGDLGRARELLSSAARKFGPREAVSRARCVLAAAEVALAVRDLGAGAKGLDAARATLEAHGDRINALHARLLEARRLLLLGRLDDAERALGGLDPDGVLPMSACIHALIAAGIAVRRLRIAEARAALARADDSARRAGIEALVAEVACARAVLEAPAARVVVRGHERAARLHEVESLLASDAFVVDACRNAVQQSTTRISLAKRPVLFTLVRVLAEAWPGDAARETLVARAFGYRHADESFRARLRVEIGRLRPMLRVLADVRTTPRGYALVPRNAQDVVVLAHPVDDEYGSVLALLGDGECWSSSALALTLGTSQRSVQRALDALAAAGKVQSFGAGRSRRWAMPPMPGFTTTLLLPLAALDRLG